MILLRKLIFLLFSCFFAITLINRLLSYFGGISLPIHQVCCGFIALAGFLEFLRQKSFGLFDFILCIYIAYIVFNALFIGSNNGIRYIYLATVIQLFPILAYYIGRNVKVPISYFLKKQKWPLLFAMVCGLYFFFVSPIWYVQMKTSSMLPGEESNIFESLRLSSFFSHPYELAYATLLYSLFLIYTLSTKELSAKNRLLYYTVLVICALVLFLAQLRVTIVMLIFAVLYNVAMAGSLKKTSKTLFGIAVLVLCLMIIPSYLKRDTNEYITEHMLSLSNSDYIDLRFEHTSGGIVDYSMLGDGFGRYDYAAREKGLFAIVDHEYQNHLAELGYVGTSLLVIILSMTFMKGIFRKTVLLELSIVVFYIIASFGASVLSNHHQYNYIFWYCVGVVWSHTVDKQSIIVRKNQLDSIIS